MKRKVFSILMILNLVLSFLAPAVPVQAADAFPLPDEDADGLANTLETAGWYSLAGGPFVTGAYDADSDDDGLTDGEEKLFSTHPLDAHSPGIAVRYEDSYKTKEYFSVTDPDYLSMIQGGDRYLMTEAMVVRRGSTISIAGPASGTLAITGTSMTTLTPVVDPARGGWTVTLPANGTVGEYTMTVTDGAWTASMPLYVIFEIPESLSADQVAAFLYDDDPANLKDEVAVFWSFREGQIMVQPCPGTDPNAPCSNWAYHEAKGYAQAFWTEQYTKANFVNHAIKAIQGKTSPVSAAPALANWTDYELRTRSGRRQNSFSSALYKWNDGTGITMDGGYCETAATVYTALLRSAGIPARPFALDYNKTSGHDEAGQIGTTYEYDHATMIWLDNVWKAQRAYNGDEVNDVYYPYNHGTTGVALLQNWDTYTGYYTDRYGDLVSAIGPEWDFQNGSNGGGTVNTVWPLSTAEYANVNRDYYWYSKNPLEYKASPYVDVLNCQMWKGDGWAPSEWRNPASSNPAGRNAIQTYTLPVGIPDIDNPLENWPYNPKPTACTSGTPTNACNAFMAAWTDVCPGLPGQTLATQLELSAATTEQHIYLPVLISGTGHNSPSVRLGSIVSDSVRDTDGDGFFDELVIEVEVIKPKAGDYQVGGSLIVGETSVRASVSSLVVTPDTKTIEVVFEGLQIADTAVDGPYLVEALWLAPPDQLIETVIDAGKMSGYREYQYLTQAFLTGQFQAQPAVILEGITHQGIDRNGNNLYEAVRINVPLQINTPGTYLLQGDLYDGQGNFVGTASWTGSDANASLEYRLLNSQPPYSLEHLYLIESHGPVVDNRYTAAYKITDLAGKIEGRDVFFGHIDQGGPALLDIDPTGSYTIVPVDSNGNGRYDILRINVGVTVATTGGNYRIEGLLVDEYGTEIAWTVSNPKALVVGNQTLTLDFDGQMIYDQLPLAPGAKALKLVAVKIFRNNLTTTTLESEAPVAITTPAYTRSQFEPSTPSVNLFEDDLENGDGKWSWSLPLWSLNNTVWHTYSNAWKGSANGAAEGALSVTSPLDLTDYAAPVLRFNHAYNLFTENDTGAVEVSLDGNTWTPVSTFAGKTTHWRAEEIDLSAYGETSGVRIRFKAKAQSGLTWYLDDVYLNAWPAVKTANFTYSPFAPTAQQSITFSASYTSIDTTQPITYIWNLNGVIQQTTNPSLTYTFDHPGDLNVQLTVQNPYDSAVISKVVHVEPAAGQLSLTTIVTPENGGAIVRNPNYSAFNYGETVTLTPEPAPGYRFDNWSGACTGSGACVVLMDSPKSVSATFTSIPYSLTVNTTGNGTVTLSPDQSTYYFGDQVELTASAQSGWSFVGWDGSLNGYENPVTITIDGDKTVNATFGLNQYTLSTSVTGQGTLTKVPAQSTYAPGQVVQVVATPTTGWRLSSWGGACSGSGDCEVKMVGNQTVTATFVRITYTLTVDTVGSGSVNRSSAGPYYYGDVVQLTAVPVNGWSFTMWSGDLAGSSNPSSITIEGNKTVTANFTQNEYTLDVTMVGEGQVHRSADGPYHYGDVIQLTAQPTSGWAFANWTGAYSGADNPASITITANTAITANFTQEEYSLTVKIKGKGSVSVSPEGPYHYHDIVTLYATPAANWTFVDWTGDRVGTANPINATINYNSVITATFNGVNIPPEQPVLVEPTNGATDQSLSPTLSVMVSDPDNDPLDVSFYGKNEDAAGNFTIIGLPDTQNYSTSYPEIFSQQTQWIVDNADELNVKFVSHFGDVTNNGDSAPQEWVNASNAMYKLDAANIPYSIAHGNHDTYGGSSLTLYNQYFGISHFQGYPWYGGSYSTSNNNHNYELFSAGGVDFIIIHLGYAPSTEARNWANNLLQTYSNRTGIVTSHDVMNTNGTFTTNGTNIYNSLRGNSNLLMILCGHNHDEARRQDTYNGHTIYSILADYQDYPNGGNGWLRIMEFRPAEDLIYFKTYSPYLNQWKTEDKSQFTIPFDMPAPVTYQLIGTNSRVASGTTTSLEWPGRDPQTLQEWYVSVSDTIDAVSSPHWNFTTHAPLLYNLTVTKSGDGSGTVTSVPAGIDCGTTCEANFTENSQVSLTAVAATGYVFRGWTGACTGTGLCTVTMDAAKTVDAKFEVAPPESTLTFRQGLNGYTGTQDTYILQSNATTAYGTSATVEWDTQDVTGDANTQKFGLLRFDSIFGTDAGQIPPGSNILSATLRYYVENAGNEGTINPALATWDEAITWNTFGASAGVQAEDYGPSLGTATSASTGAKTLDVKASLEAWAIDPQLNKGWIFIPSGTDGIDITSSEGSTSTNRPSLTVVFYSSVPGTCYPLTLTHTGQGADPVAAPDHSSGCDAGEYVANQQITLTAAPATLWKVGSWTGTTNNASTGVSNTVLMPAQAHTAGANYIEQGVEETLTFQQGVSGYIGTLDTYVREEAVDTASGDLNGFEWDDDATSGNMLDEISLLRFENVFGSGAGQIPPGASIVSATLWYKVSTDTNAQGSNGNVYESLVTWPENVTWNTFGGDAGVNSDEYANSVGTAAAGTAGQAYTVDVKASLQRWSANPSSNFGWVILPAGTDGVKVWSSEYTTTTDRPKLTVTYSTGVQPTCYALTLSHSGEGADPTASPANSTGCPTGQYTHNASITLTAAPAQGMSVTGWTGTTNDASRANTNTVLMPAAAHSASVAYGETPPSTLTCETFDSLTPGSRIGSYTGWFSDAANGPAVTAGAGVAGSVGLGSGSSIYNWTAYDFNWNNPSLTKVVLQQDFRTDSGAKFNDDRIAWSYQPTNNSSNYQFGVQLDNVDNGGIVAYWSHTIGGAKVYTTITPLTGVKASTWYRFRADISKLTDTSARIDVTLTELDSAGNPTGAAITGSIPDTAAMASTVTPAAQYFTATNMVPSFKNHTDNPANADNACVEVVAGPVTCYPLTLTHTGSGTDPTASPASSTGCSAGQYVASQQITLTAAPASGWQVASWMGTTNNSSTATTNTVTMPAAAHTASVTYAEAGAPVTVTFQDGAAGYSGTVDTFIRGTNEGNTNFSTNPGLEWDENTGTTTDEITLIRFGQLFASEAGPIPAGATITSASLTYMTTDLDSGSTAYGDPGNVYESLVDWPGDTVTYNNFGGEAGVQTDEYRATPVVSAPATAISTAYTVDVTASLQRWMAAPAENLGWIILPTAADGVTIYSSEAATVAYRPLLSVTYVVPEPEGFAFVVTTDWHPNDSASQYVNNLQQVKTLIDTPPAGMPAPSFMVITGDFPNLSQTESAIDSLLGVDYLWYPAIGNHEISDAGNNFALVRDEKVPTLPNIVNHGPTGSVNTTYSFDYGNAHFVILNPFWDGATNDHTSGGDIPSALQTWLTDDLSVNAQMHTFAFLHTPPFPDNRHIGEDLDALANQGRRDTFVTTLDNNNVEAVFAGHTHYYDHAVASEHPLLGDMSQVTNGAMRYCTGGETVTITYVYVKDNISTFKVYSRTSCSGAWSEIDTWTYTQPLPCYALTLTHSGSGADPAASPANSAGCSAGQYHQGESITLTAAPDANYQVGSWTGTNNNGATTLTNTVTMPAAAHTAGVNYIPQMTCESFDAMTAGSKIGTFTGWYSDATNGPTVTAGVGVAGSTGLGSGSSIYNWTAKAFNWNDPNLTKVVLQQDFQTDSGARFNDDRITWTYQPLSNDSDYEFGVQLDNVDNGGIVAYWSHTITGAKVYTTITPLTGLKGSTWYRFHADITKLTATSAMIDVTLTELDSSGNPTGTPITGSIPNTAAMASTVTPAAEYFTATSMVPSFKNHTTNPAPVDNACYQVVTGSAAQYTLTTTATGGGSITRNPDQATYAAGTVVTLTAVPDAGKRFVSWSGDLIGSASPTTITMNGNKTVTATFADIPVCYALTLSYIGNGANPTASPVNSAGCATGQYVAGENIALTATPDSGYEVSAWTGTNNDALKTLTNTLTMPAAAGTVSVTYSLIPPSQLVCETFDGMTVGQVIGVQPGWAPAGSPAVVAEGLAGTRGLGSSSVIYNWTAHPFNWNATDFQKLVLQQDFKTDNNATFDDDRLSWTIDGASTASNNQFGVQLDHPNGGIVTYWSSTMGGTRLTNPIVSLTSGMTKANTWYRFHAEITKLTATSARIDVSLVELDAAGNPTGTPITGSIPNTASWIGGAGPAAGYFAPTSMVPSYKNYTTSAAPADNACYQVVTTAAQYTLTVNAGTGGMVTLDPDQATYAAGTEVTLTATPDTGYEFAGWSGDLTGSVNPATITMDGNKTVSAAFELIPAVCYTLTRTHTGIGDDPTASPTNSAGCGANQYTEGTTITLTAAPGSGYRVTSWSGTDNDASTSLTNAVTMPAADRTVSAIYGEIPANPFPVAAGSIWKYLDNGTNQGTAWKETFFDDSAWAEGPAQLGYGDGDEATVVDCSNVTNCNTQNFITTYFRHTFTVTDPVQFIGLNLRVLRDDGAVVYLNGDEIWRTNMPTGAVAYNTLASTAISGAQESTEFVAPTSSLANTLVAGQNVLAVEVHQNAITSTDVSFDLELTGVPRPECYLLNLSHSGNGADPAASPASSTGCEAGQYVAGETITLTAAPDSGNRVASWTGTANDASKEITNTVTMPAAAHSAAVNYEAGLPPVTVTFQQGVSGYAGTQDTYILQTAASAGLSFGDELTIEWDTEDTGGNTSTQKMALLRFENIFGGGVGQIPPGSEILSASLTYYVSNAAPSAANVNPVLVDWTEATSWNTFGPEAGVQEADYGAQVTTAPAGTINTAFTIDVQASLAAWALDPAANKGWIFRPTNTDGADVTSSEGATVDNRPKLTVTYIPGEPPACYALTLSHTGNGADPAANPASSFGCDAGQYWAGSTVTLTAAPASGYQVKNWTGTTNDASPAATNTVTMPAADHAAGVTYELIPPSLGWTAYNDMSWYTGQLETNITTYTIGSPGNTGLLKNFSTGANTGVTATITSYNIGSRYENGNNTNAGTDSYNTFNGKVNLVGVVNYGTSGWWVDVTLTGLDPSKTYTLAATANRADATMTGRISRFTLSGAEAATNASTSGVTVVDNNNVAFSTGYNTENGYVARWTSIQPGVDGTIVLRTQAHTSEYRAYAPSAFLLQEEPSGVPQYTLTVNAGTGGMVTLDPDQATYAAGTEVTLTATPDTGYEFTGWSGDLTGSINPVTIIMDGNKTVTAAFAPVAPTCYALALSHTGQGADPTANPASSTGCEAGQYVAGESITLTAAPDSGYEVSAWTGTNDDALKTLTNTLTMPAAARTVTVTYSLVPPSQLVCESFDSFTPGNRIGTYLDWFGDTGAPVVTAGAGVAGTIGLSNGQYVFNWSGKPFTWSDANVQKVVFQGDFQSHTAAGWFDDDRLAWTTTPSSTSSNNEFGAQLDPNAIVTYWSTNMGSTKVTRTIVPLTGIKASTWYRFKVEITKLTGTSAKLDVSLTELDAAGNPTGTPITGTVADTAALATNEKPATGYFTAASMAPSFKNYNTITGNADNLCYQAGITAQQYTLTVNTDGGGSVTLDPAGGIYDDGTTVTLTTTPDTGYDFAGFSGDLTSATSPATIVMDGDKNVTATFEKQAVTLTVNQPATGGVINVTPAGPYEYGDVVTVSSVADTGYNFTGWTDDLSGTITPTTLTLNGNKTIGATFEKQVVTLTVNQATGGTIAVTPAGPYEYGAEVTLTATPDLYYHFVSWTGDCSGTTATCTLPLDGNKTVGAIFAKDTVTLTVNQSTGGTIAPAGGTYEYGMEVALTAAPDLHYHFVSWTGDCSGTTATCTLTLDGDKTVGAIFAKDTVTLTVTTSGSGTVDQDPAGPYVYGDEVELTALPAAGWHFVEWTGDLTGSTNPAMITLNGSKTVEAVFAQDSVTLTVTTSGSGTVDQDPVGPYVYGDEVELTALPAAGWHFVEWTGDLTGSTNPATITLNGSKTVEAVFAQDSVTLTVTTSGSGTVNQNPAGPYVYGDEVELTAVPSTGWHFVEWTGDLTGSTNPATITLNGSKTVEAVFAQDSVTLTVTTSGSGTVNQNPAGPYVYGDEVELNAVPAAGWHFVEWTGDLTGTDNPATITLNGNKTVTATFEKQDVTLTVNQPTTGGVINVTPAGPYHYGDEVTLTATADLGYSFTGWTGDLSGADNPTTLILNGDKAISATFELNVVTLTITQAAGGVISVEPAGPYHYGDVVTVEAMPEPGYSFTGWTGDLSGMDNPTTLVLNGDKAVSATFELNVVTLTITQAAGGVISVEPAGPYHYGDEVTLTATADLGYSFTGWTGDLSGADNPAMITLNGSKTVAAVFAKDTVTLTVNQATGGTISPAGGTYDYGSEVMLTATPDLHYHFVSWTDDCSGTTATCTLTLDGNKTVGAIFAKDTVTLTVNQSAGGTITPAGGTYEYGMDVVLTATANSDYTFAGWTGDLSGTENPTTLTLDGDKTVGAIFESSPVNDLIFENGFESGDLTGWSSAVIGGGDLSVSSAAALVGNWGLQAVVNDNTLMYVVDQSPDAETRYRARFYFDPNSLAMGNLDRHLIFAGFQGTSTNNLQIEMRFSGGSYNLRVGALDDGGVWRYSAWGVITDAVQMVEIDWQASSAAGANDGHMTIWINGVQAATVTGMDTDTRRIDFIRLGAVSGIDTNTRGTYYFDAFESHKTNYIGPAIVTADFTATPASGLLPLVVSFTNQTQPTDPANTYLWDFGDGATSTLANPTHTYTTAGSFTVTLTATGPLGSDQEVKTDYITVTESPALTADFTATPASGLLPLVVSFTNQTQPTDPANTYLWDFGDGATSTLANPTHTYTTAGSFTVTLTATGPLGSDQEVKTAYITVTEPTDLIFENGFESGDLTGWSSAVIGGGDLSVSSAAALVGNWGLQAVVNDNTLMYVVDQSPDAETRYRARFYFDPNSLAMGNLDRHLIFAGFQGTSTNNLQIEMRFSGGSYNLRVGALDDGGVWRYSAWGVITDAVQMVEIDWQASSAAGANDGHMTIWINGVQAATVTGMDTDTRRIDFIRLGAVSGIDTNTRGTYYFDAFESHKTNYIGPEG